VTDLDPTTTAIATQIEERDKILAENVRLSSALVAARIDAEKAFVEGYDQAVGEIHRHFKKLRATEVAAQIEKIWLVEKGA